MTPQSASPNFRDSLQLGGGRDGIALDRSALVPPVAGKLESWKVQSSQTFKLSNRLAYARRAFPQGGESGRP